MGIINVYVHTNAADASCESTIASIDGLSPIIDMTQTSPLNVKGDEA